MLIPSFKAFLLESENPEKLFNENISFEYIDHVEHLTEEDGKSEKLSRMINREHPEQGIRSCTPLDRRSLLPQGWRDVLKIEKFFDDGKYSQKEIDPRDFPSYESKGWKKGWTNYPMIDLKGIRKYVTPKAYKNKKAEGWKDYEPTSICKKKISKSGQDDYEYKTIDKGELQKYLDDGWEEGWKKSEDYYTSFAIQRDNSKLGKNVANFSLAPVSTCPADVPCKGDGCYALKAYNQYPACKMAWDKNTQLLKEHPDWLVRDVDNFLSKNGSNIDKFRWQVSGDLLNKQHLDAIIQIANHNPNVLFWLYTKKYDLVDGTSPPNNLVIILSAWNEYKLDKIRKMHKRFPVAWLDDWDHKDLIPPDDESFICPCADDRVGDAIDDKHCATCKTHSERHGKTDTHPCYQLRAMENLIFRKH